MRELSQTYFDTLEVPSSEQTMVQLHHILEKGLIVQNEKTMFLIGAQFR